MNKVSIIHIKPDINEEVKKFILDMFCQWTVVGHTHPPHHGKFADLFVHRGRDEDSGKHIFGSDITIPLDDRYLFEITFLKRNIHFPQPNQYWAYYIQCLARNEVVNHFYLPLVDYNEASKQIPVNITFKNYLNFLRYMFKGKQKQAARKHYLEDLKRLPPAARNLEGIKTFL